MFNHENYFQFIQITPTEGEQSFISYTNSNGDTLEAIASVDQNGYRRPFVVTWSARNRIYRGQRNKKIMVVKNGEMAKMPLYDYIKGFVEIMTDRHGNPLFKELDEVKDAKLALSRKELVVKASNKALELKGAELEDMAALIGVFVQDPDVQKFRVVEFADQDPQMFLDILNSPDFKVKALVRKATKSGTALQKGKTVEWAGQLFADESDFISALLKDEKKLNALEKQVNKNK